MANSITAAPAVLAQGVISSLSNKLPVLSGISTVFSARPGTSGMSIQVPLIGTSSATAFSTGGYLTQDDATVTSSTVSLTHYKVSSRFTPSNLKEYGAQFFVNNFVNTASIALAQKVMDVINAQVTNANYSTSSTTGANLSYAELIAAQKTLDDAKAPQPRYAVLNSGYIADLRADTTIVGNNVLGAQIIRDGDLGTIAGARVYQFANLATNSENLAGWVAGPDAIAFASALPETDIPGWEVANATDEGTGLSVQVIMGQEQSGYMNVTATLLFGAAVGRATSLVRLKTA
ncbi:MAG: hypothetical protein RIR91_361 [Verrucomicrobiota bacterium]|jgi:hypothetical protein